MTRELEFFKALREATELCMEADARVYIMGLGVPDPRGIFGTTLGLAERFGRRRVLDMPTSENAMTGIAIGSALVGNRPILTHQRLDFALLSMDQIVNNAAKWRYMFGGQQSVPLVIRLIVGRGWGQGPQHSQSLQSWFAHVPGLKVVMPATPYDAKGLLISAIEDNDPVIFIEHRWLYNIKGEVPAGMYRVPLGSAQVRRAGSDITIVALSHMTIEALRAADRLATMGISAEVVDVRTLRPLDTATIVASAAKTGRVLVADTGWKTGGFSAEIVAAIVERAFTALRCAPRRVALPDTPTPTSAALVQHHYPGAHTLVHEARAMLGLPEIADALPPSSIPADLPDSSFTGPF